MTLRLLAITGLLSLAAGCEWLLVSDEPHFTEASALTAPWDGLSLPTAGGTVTFSDAETLSVHHQQTEPKALGASYGAALVAAGWTLEADTSAGQIVNHTYTREGTSLALSVMTSDGAQVVSLSLLPF